MKMKDVSHRASKMKEVVIEMQDLLLGARIDRVQQLDPYTFLFLLYNMGTTFYLVLSVRKSSKRFHLIFEKIYRSYLLSTGTTDILKKYLTGGRITRAVIKGDVVDLHISGSKQYILTADFQTLNLTLIDDEGVLLHALHRRDPHITESNHAENIILSEQKTKGFPPLPMNKALSMEFLREREQALKRDVLQVLRSEEKKLLRLELKLVSEKEEIREKERYRMVGELIKYNLQKIPKGARSVILNDFSGEEVLVELDRVLSPRENMETYFKKYKKLKKRGEVIDAHLSSQKKKLATIHRAMDRVQKEEHLSLKNSPEDLLKSIDTSLLGKRFFQKLEGLRRKSLEPGRRRDEAKGKYLQFTSRSGKKILVGRSAKENEEISLRIARGNDLWFHTESVPGSHVVLQYRGKGEFLEEDIMDAAQLALYFSKMRKEEKGNVQYTRCKYIRKLKNEGLGKVTYYNEKTKLITLDQEILGRLLKPPE